MRDSIRKILKEYTGPPKGNREERIAEIQRRFERINEMVPTFVTFFEKRYGDILDKLEVDSKKIHYGAEMFTGGEIVLKFYLNTENKKIRHEIWDDIKNYFGIDMTKYGVPLDIDVRIRKYERV